MDIETETSTGIHDNNFFGNRPNLLLVSMAILFLLGGAGRLYDLESSGVLVEREYRSAIIARSFYFEATDSIPAWRKEIARITKERELLLEPPITEFLVSILYRLIGSEQLWISRFLTSAFWLIGGFFLFRIARYLTGSADAAVVSLTYYLFVPLAILTSRSFQPDSLMIMMFIISLYCVVWYDDKPTRFRLFAAGTSSGLTLLIRPLCLFTILFAFMALAICRSRRWQSLLDRHSIIFVAVTGAPLVLYYIYGIFFAGFLAGQAEMSFRPHLWLHREYWQGWLHLATDSVGFTPLVASLIGLPLLRSVRSRALLIGLWLGYLVFGLVFSFHIHTTTYYHLQFIVIVSLSVGPLVMLLVNHLRSLELTWFWWTPVLAVLLLLALFSAWEVRRDLKSRTFESEQTAREIGELISHRDKVVYLARYYGGPLKYYGELSGAYWPRRITYWLYRRADEQELSIDERLAALDFLPEYFVITDFNEFYRHHSDLETFLAANCSLIAEDDAYLIYGHCLPPAPEASTTY